MRKNIQGKVSITLDIPDNIEDVQAYVREFTNKIAQLKMMKEYQNVMLISQVETSDEGLDFLDDKEYYKDYYDAIFPEDFEN